MHFPKKVNTKAFAQRNISNYFGHRIQADLGFFGDKIVLVVCDVYTKFLSVRIIQSKFSNVVASHFEDIFLEDYLPFQWLPIKNQVTLLVDNGTEFKAHFKTVCDTLQVALHPLSSSAAKANLAERFIGESLLFFITLILDKI